MSKKMFGFLNTAFNAGYTLQVTDWHGVTFTVSSVSWREHSDQMALTAVDHRDPPEAPVVEHPVQDKNQVYLLTVESAALMHSAVTHQQIKTDYQLMEPHLESIKEAFPDAKVYVIRDHRLREVRDYTNPALLVQYGESDDHQPGPMKYHGFSVWPDGKITYTEAEAWRYKLHTTE